MRALRCDEHGTLSVIQRDEPVAGPGEVLVRIRRVGVCGTDYHIYHGNQPYLEYPRVIGHELSGEVVETTPVARFGQATSSASSRTCIAGRAMPASRTRLIAVSIFRY